MSAQMTAHEEPSGATEVEAARRLSEAAITGLATRNGPVSAESLAQALTDGPWLDELMNQVDDSGLRLTGEGGFLPALIKAVLEKIPPMAVCVFTPRRQPSNPTTPGDSY